MIPPNNVAAERHLLGVLLRDNLPLPPALKASDFFEPVHQDIAGAVLSLAVDGIAPDELTVTQRLRDMGSPVLAETVSVMVSDSGSSTYRTEHVDLISNAALLRQASEIAARATNPDALLDHYARLAEQRKATKREKDIGEWFDLDALDAFNPLDDKTVLVGKSRRWLCEGYAVSIVGFSGTGKSSLMMQVATAWALGQSVFGLAPVRPLRTLILQAENDGGDIAESWQGSTCKMTESEKTRLKQNIAIVRDTKHIGGAFPEFLETLILRHQAEVVWIDPLLAYAGFDIADQSLTTEWLRTQVDPVLKRTKAAMIYMHHTTKPKSADDLDSMTPSQLAYLGAGSAEWVNYSRDAGFLYRTKGEPARYKFGFSKRASRCGLENAEGERSKSGFIYLQHSPEDKVLRWEHAPSGMEVAPSHTDSRPAKGSRSRPDYV
tara:strand:+ start:397 stop:1701 length:1305 start_codon:yes stop_codon:yes gene_type:complete